MDVVFQPKVSICIPNYNYGQYLSQAIESALSQTYENLEIIITDNASTDNSMQVLEQYRSNPKVKIFRNAETVSIAENHNMAFSHATGDYICLLSSDDLLLPKFVERTLKVYEKYDGDQYNIGLVMAEKDLIDADGKKTHFVPFYPGSFVCKGEKQARVCMMGNPGQPSLWLFKRAAFEKVGGFKSIYGTAHDWGFIFDVCFIFDFAYLNEKLCLYRKHENISSKSVVNLRYPCDIHLLKLDITAKAAQNAYLAQYIEESLRRTSTNAVKFGMEALRTKNYIPARRYLTFAQVFDETIVNTPVYKALDYSLSSNFETPEKVFNMLENQLELLKPRKEPYEYPDDVEMLNKDFQQILP
jgi:glycosyltransferase involved in cell wall biosynthesis